MGRVMRGFTEKQSLKYSMVGAFLLSLWGLGMSIYSQSEAILLDGAFNLISAIVAFFSIRVAHLTSKGSDQEFPLGYYSFESLIVLIKGISMLVLIVIAISSNLPVLLSGGREPAIELMAIYVFPAVAGCFILYYICYLGYRANPSDLLKAEKQAWLINAVISGAIGLALVIVLLLASTSLAWISRYIDQILVILFSLAFIGEPIKLVRGGVRELLLARPSEEFVAPIKKEIALLSLEYKLNIVALDIIKTGRHTWVTIILNPEEDEINVRRFMELKQKARALISRHYTESYTEIIIEAVK